MLSLSFSVYLIMSTLQNEMILENLYEEVLTELKDNDTYSLYTEWEITNLVQQLFEDMSS